MSRVVIVTGASSGIGRVCADELHRRGWKVHGVSRSIEQLTPAPAFERSNVDITDSAQVTAMFDRVGAFDAIVNCAGHALAGPVEETTIEQSRQQMDVNFLSTANVCRLAIPRLRARGKGVIINVSSIAAHVPMAFQAWYSASKAALTSFTRALRLEVLPFGIQVVSLEPGDYATNITAVRKLSLPVASSTYPAFARTLAVIERDERGASAPDEIGIVVAKLLDRKRTPASVLVGQFIQRFAVTLRAMLPERLFDWILSKLYSL